jgi:hypothetical protein
MQQIWASADGTELPKLKHKKAIPGLRVAQSDFLKRRK